MSNLYRVRIKLFIQGRDNKLKHEFFLFFILWWKMKWKIIVDCFDEKREWRLRENCENEIEKKTDSFMWERLKQTREVTKWTVELGAFACFFAVLSLIYYYWCLICQWFLFIVTSFLYLITTTRFYCCMLLKCLFLLIHGQSFAMCWLCSFQGINNPTYVDRLIMQLATYVVDTIYYRYTCHSINK